MVGTHFYDDVNGFCVFTETHVMWIIHPEDRNARNNNAVSEVEMDMLSKQIDAAGGTYEITSPNRAYIDVTHSLNPELIGARVQLEYEWIDEQRSQSRVWVLNEDGARTGQTSTATRID